VRGLGAGENWDIVEEVVEKEVDMVEKEIFFMLENVESENLFQGQDFLWWEERTETTMGVKKGLSLLSCQQVINKLNLF
jgi:hypothetical protein